MFCEEAFKPTSHLRTDKLSPTGEKTVILLKLVSM